MKTKENIGVTLIALAVTIIVMLILAGVTIATLTSENGIITQASQAKIQNEFAKYVEEIKLYNANKFLENQEFDEGTLTAGRKLLNYNTKRSEEEGNIKSVIPSIKDEYLSSLQIIKGKAYIKTEDKKQLKAALAVGIEENPYDITDDGELLSSNNNLLLIDSEGTLVVPDMVKIIGQGAFSGVENLKTIIIPESTIEIGNYAFANNKAIEKVIIQGENLKRIGSYAFDQASNLQEINLPNSISEIGILAFRNTSLSEVIIPQNLNELYTETFAFCSKIKKVVLQKGMKSIKEKCFYNTSIESIQIPSTIESIDAMAFSGCNKLTKIDVSQNNNFVFENQMLFNKDKTQILFIAMDLLVKQEILTIPEKVISFSYDITDYSNIKKIIIPSTLEKISARALPSSIESIEVNVGNSKIISENGILYNTDNELLFCYSKNSNVIIQEGIKKINDYAMKGAINALNITFPDSLETIGIFVFDKLSKISNIKISKNVSNIMARFKSRNYSGIVTIDSQNPYYVIENNVLYKKSNGKKETLVCVLNEINGTIQINSEVKTIGNSAFYGQGKLTQIYIPEGVTKISGGAFGYCSNLKKVEISKTVTTIESCFGDATNNLEEIIIHNNENAISGTPWGAVKGIRIVKWLGK